LAEVSDHHGYSLYGYDPEQLVAIFTKEMHGLGGAGSLITGEQDEV
jgi:hypothetical protein